MASIAVRQRHFKVGHSPFGHNYLVLYDDDGNFVAELHGWPADASTGKADENAVGRSWHNLRSFEYPYKHWFQEKRRRANALARVV